MSKSRLWVTLTILTGIITGFLAWQYLTGVKATAVNEVMSTVVMTTYKVPNGTRLTSAMVKTVRVPAGSVPAQASTQPEQVIGQMTIAELREGEIITAQQLASSQTGNEVPYKIPAGYRAITIAVNPLSGVAGHIKPGHYVDILMRYITTANPPEIKVITLVQNSLVLAAGPDLQKKEGVQAVENITMAVTPQDAQNVMLSEKIGEMKLVLRPATDSKKAPLKSADLKVLQQTFK